MYRFQKSPPSHKMLWLTGPDHVTQAVLIFIPFWFSIVLFNKQHAFEASTIYYYMLRQMSEANWACFSCLTVIFATMCWATNNRYALIVQNCILMMWHGLVAICIFMGNPISPGSGT